MDELLEGLEGSKITFGLQPHHIQRIESERVRWNKDSETDVIFAPFYFYKSRKKTNNIFVRLSVIFIPVAFIILVAGIPFNFFVTGNWGYKKVDWFSKWATACGL